MISTLLTEACEKSSIFIDIVQKYTHVLEMPQSEFISFVTCFCHKITNVHKIQSVKEIKGYSYRV